MPDDEARTEGDADAARLTARLAQLERENAALREQVALAGPTPASSGSEAPGAQAQGRRRHRGRSAAALVLILLGVLLAPVAVVASWAQRELTDTDRYVATVGPLASDPVIQSAIENRLTEVVMEQLDVPTLVHDAVSALNRPDLPPRAAAALGAVEQPLTDGIQSLIRKAATTVVESDAFETAWIEANRVAHAQLIAVMKGEPGSVLQIGDQGQLTIELSGVIDTLKAQLVKDGFSVAANIPTVNASFTLVQTTQLVKLQNAYSLLDVVGTWLPWLSLGLIAVGVLTAVHRSRALVVAGLALAASMLVLGIGLYIGRSLYLDGLAGKVERLDAAEIVFDQLVAFIRVALRTVAVLGLVVAAAAYLGGGSDSARGVRAGIGRAFAAARTAGQRRGVTTGPVGLWLYAHRTLLRVLIIALAGLVILLAPAPTPAIVVTVAVVAVAAIALLELLARPPVPSGESAAETVNQA
ncbi:hypothetical protein SAMN05216410_1501 [Sanguibacter gelidistatuariae]|uniref:Integral membrane protein n=1 Tax=Sanguibacter gelidistatuariae TaxID=1814289 RepID=A0A1G6K4M0_9MICO|nr:hypothetical protein [Sanguibacter gelidistatuariae]SDC25979.1 hypothetical protein SAMN05216410_1501 [Sanguibacter gelidistatuariae]